MVSNNFHLYLVEKERLASRVGDVVVDSLLMNFAPGTSIALNCSNFWNARGIPIHLLIIF